MKIRKAFVTWDEFYGALGGGAGTPTVHTHVKADITDTPWAWANVSKVGSNLTDLATHQHAGLTNVTSDQHHAQDHAAEHEVGGGDLLAFADITGFGTYLDQAVKVASDVQFHNIIATGGITSATTFKSSTQRFIFRATPQADTAYIDFNINNNAIIIPETSGYFRIVEYGTWNDLIYVKATGEVGIGRSPDLNLDVAGLPGVASLVAENGITRIGVDGSIGLEIGADGVNAPYPMWIQSKHPGINTAYPLILNPVGGNVGIGKIPTEKLDVDGDIRTTGSILGNSATDKLLLSGDTESAYAMSILGSTGYVGIRKLVPTCALDVNGTIKATTWYLNLGGLLDVNIATPLKYQSIYYIGGEWVNRPEITLDMPYMSYKMYTDFFDREQNPPWTGYDVNNGTRTDVVGLAKHPGIITIRSAAQVNSGYRYTTGQSGGVFPILIAGEEMAEIVFKTKSPVSQRLMYYGYHNSNTPGVILNGVCLYINTLGRLYGRTISQGVGDTVTGTYYQLNANIWYRARLEVNEDATRVDFWLYDEAGLQLWTSNLVANIPIAGGKEVAHTLMTWYEPATAVDIYDIDFMAGVCFRPIARG